MPNTESKGPYYGQATAPDASYAYGPFSLASFYPPVPRRPGAPILTPKGVGYGCYTGPGRYGTVLGQGTPFFYVSLA